MSAIQPMNKSRQQLIAAQVIFRLRKLHPNAKIDVFIGDNLRPNGTPKVTIEIDGVRQLHA